MLYYSVGEIHLFCMQFNAIINSMFHIRLRFSVIIWHEFLVKHGSVQERHMSPTCLAIMDYHISQSVTCQHSFFSFVVKQVFFFLDFEHPLLSPSTTSNVSLSQPGLLY